MTRRDLELARGPLARFGDSPRGTTETGVMPNTMRALEARGWLQVSWTTGRNRSRRRMVGELTGAGASLLRLLATMDVPE